ncbi:MAG: cytochrome d ubiquinol oxidase subunit II [Chloroflexi bacterium HGW-Chloroflexi-10]|nr:MAG: cytochrome d ubiquinol oxidase subunit II [Chloroflexi bacterium HGW-Chloroflexi-10]
MSLETLWFILIGVLFVGYFVLEGFDMGVGILLLFVSKTDIERRMVINTIGPHWDGNEVWLITAGGAMFAAFPQWYATLFSGFYIALFLMLIALIVRGVAFEFRSKDDSPRWKRLWDGCIFFGSLIPAFLWGVAFANIVKGVPIDADFHYVGSFWNLINGYSIVGGLVTLTGFLLLGAIFLSLKLEKKFADRINKLALKLWIPNILILLLFVTLTYFETDILSRLGINPGVVPIGAIMSILAVGWFVYKKQSGWAFILMSLGVVFSVSTIFMILYPRLMISSLDPEFSLTIINSASSPYTLKIMSIVALIFVPIVLAYQAWSYWIFRKRITSDPKNLHY